MVPEEFLSVADLLPEPMLLVSSECFILAANRATESKLGISAEGIRGKKLSEIVNAPVSDLARYLTLCSRTRSLVPGVMEFYDKKGGPIAWRVEGTTLRPKTETSDAILMLRLTPKESATGQFVVLNQRIEELGKELLRRRRAEETLRQQEERLRVTLQSIGDAVITTDTGGNVTNMNAIAESLTGCSLAYAWGLPLQQVFCTINESTREPVENPLTLARHEGGTVGIFSPTVLIAKDGTERFVDDNASPIRSAEGQVLGYVLVFKDVSERRHLQQQVADQLATARLLASIIESSDDSIVRTSLDGIIETWNVGAQRLFGYTAEQAIGCPIYLMIPPDRVDEEGQIMARIRNSEPVEHYETVRRRSDGTLVDVSLTVSPIRNEAGELIAVSKIARDITRQKLAELNLNESQQRYRALAEASATVVWRTTASGELVFSSNAWHEITGQTEDETKGWGWLQAVHPDDQDRSVKLWQKSLKTRTVHENQFRVRTEGGSYRWFSVRGVPIYNEDGSVREWVGANTDIHDRKVAESTLLASEAFNSAVFESSPDCLKVLDAQGGLIKMNDRGRCVMEIDAFEPYVGRSWCDLWPVEGRVQVEESMERARRGELTLFEGFCPTAKGTWKWWEVVVAPVFAANGQIEKIVAASRDITDRRLAAEVLIDSQARLSLGVQVAGLALAEIDYENGLVHLSAEASQFFGLGEMAMSVPRETVHATFHPEDREALMDCIAHSLNPNGAGGFAMDHRIVWGDGEVRWLRVRKQVFFAGEGDSRRPVKAILAVLDVTAERHSAEALRASGEFVRGVLDSLPEHVLVLDEHGIVSMVNEQWRYFADQNDGPLHQLSVGSNYLDVFARAAAAGDLRMNDKLTGLVDVLDGRISEFVAEYACVVRGQEHWFLLHARRASVGPPGVVLSHINFTQRKQAELEIQLSEERLRNAAEAAGFGMIHADLMTGTVTYSKELKSIVGLPSDDDRPFIAGQVPDWVHPDDRESLEQFHRELLQRPEGTSDSIDHRIIRYDGTDRWVRLKAKPLRSGKGGDRRVTQLIATLLDITQQRHFEQSLKEALVLAEAASQAKSAFLANMSHEIRTPMTAILGYTDLVADKVPEGETALYLRTIKSNGEFLLQIINDILDLSKIEAGKFEAVRERFSPVSLIEDVRSVMEVRANENKIQFSVEYQGPIPAEIESDPRCLKQILINLIGNAIKFTKDGSVRVTVLHTDPFLEFNVIDTGIGISAEQQRRVFEPFSQADPSVARTFGGTGLGLAISSRLARTLGGEVTVQSELEKGSEFTVTIATGNIEGVALIDPHAPTKPLELIDTSLSAIHLNCRILIVDDRREIRYLSKHLLNQAGATTIEAEDGEQALRIVTDLMRQGSLFDLILLDMQMPRLDGYATAAHLRALGYAGPIIALTADAMQGDMSRCLASGCDDYLSKPIDKQKLLEKLGHFLRKRHTRQISK